jgi:VanZ family protein
MKRFWKYYFAPVFWAALIFWNSSRSNIHLPNYFFKNLDKIIHFGIYFILGYLITRALSGGEFKNLTCKIFSLSILLGILYGMSDEYHQLFVPGRSMDLFDLLADVAGIIIAQVAIYFHYQKTESRHLNINT